MQKKTHKKLLQYLRRFLLTAYKFLSFLMHRNLWAINWRTRLSKELRLDADPMSNDFQMSLKLDPPNFGIAWKFWGEIPSGQSAQLLSQSTHNWTAKGKTHKDGKK